MISIPEAHIATTRPAGCFNPAENSRPGERQAGREGDGEIQSWPGKAQPGKQGRGWRRARPISTRTAARSSSSRTEIQIQYFHRDERDKKKRAGQKRAIVRTQLRSAGGPSQLPLPFAIIFFSFLPPSHPLSPPLSPSTRRRGGRMISRRITLSLCAKLDVQRRQWRGPLEICALRQNATAPPITLDLERVVRTYVK